MLIGKYKQVVEAVVRIGTVKVKTFASENPFLDENATLTWQQIFAPNLVSSHSKRSLCTYIPEI